MLIEPDELERKAAELRAKLSEWELGYLVGLVEGEAGFDIKIDKRIGRGYPRIQIRNINRFMLNYFRNKLNIGNIYINKTKGNRRPIYHWMICGKETFIFLKIIFNRLFSCKKVKAALLFALNLNNGGTFVKKIDEKIKYLNSVEESTLLNRLQCSRFLANNIGEFEKGLMAGLFESEGSVSISKKLDTVSVNITSTCPKIINKILSFSRGWGLEIIERPPWRRAYQIYLCNNNAKEFLKIVEDYLMMKRDRAEIALEFIETLGRPWERVSSEIKNRRQELYLRLHALNQKGSPYSGGPAILAPPHFNSGIEWRLPHPLSSLDI